MKNPSILLAWLPMWLACNASEDPSTANFDPNGGSGPASNQDSGTPTSKAPASSSGTVGAPATPVTAVTAVDPNNPASICSQSSFQPNAASLDMLIVQDRSWSMNDPSAIPGTNKWTLLTRALQQFVSDPQSAGMGAGIVFFSLFNGPVPEGPGPESNISCDVNAYATPQVPIGQLDGTSGGTAGAILAAIQATSPAGWTPTRVAELGAVQYAQHWATQNPAHRVVVVLATDGLPNACNSTIDSVAQIAANGVNGTNGPAVRTYVIGVYGAADQASPSNLNQIAAAGGTGTSFVVNGGSAQAEEQFLTAMNAIRQSNEVGCQYDIPRQSSTGYAIDMSQATVVYTSGNGTRAALLWHASSSECGSGYYYDDDSHPTTIRLCGSTCSSVMGDPEAKIDILFGCSSDQTGGGPGGGTGKEPPSPACLLTGQSCQDSSECCDNVCTNGVCSVPLN